MTAIACWLVKKDNVESIWVVGDSRAQIKLPDSKTLFLNTDHCAKIFKLQIVCYQPGPSGFFDQLSFTHSIGFAYAGSSLIGLNAFVMLNQILSAIAYFHNPYPYEVVNASPQLALSDVAYVATKIIKKIASDIGDKRDGTLRGVEAAICGYSRATSKHESYHIHPTPDLKDLTCEPFSLHEEGSVLLLGSHNTEIIQKIKDARSKVPNTDTRWPVMPKHVIDTLIKKNEFPEIGGATQFGIADTSGFRLLGMASPEVEGKPKARPIVLGFDMFKDIGMMGHFGAIPVLMSRFAEPPK
jgi:hypothetical protein